MQKPNVWFIMMDQARWDALGCYGNKICETVNLDYFAAQGTVFENCYTPTPTCLPARSSLLTGKDPWNVGVMYPDPAKKGTIDLGTTLPKVLSDNGYHTQCVGTLGVPPLRATHGFHDVRLYTLNDQIDSDYTKWFNENKPADCGQYDHGLGPNSWMCRPWHLPEYLHPVAWTAQESIRFLKRRDPTRPFFLKTSFLRPHAPYDPPQYYFDLYNNKELPESVAGGWAGMHDFKTTDPDAWHGRLGAENERRAKVGYYASINFIDHQIGVVRQHLSQQGLLNNTIIIFTSDHGDMMGDHHLWRKCYPYEGSAHIPLLVCLPSAMRENIQSSSEAPVCLQDIMPTILDACGVEIPEGVDGKSVLPLIREAETAWRDFVHGEHKQCYATENEHHFLTDGTWKYIWLTQTNTEQLFHLKNDPYELTDLAAHAQYQEELAKWRERLIEDLAPRNAGLVENGQLVCQAGKPTPVSPHYRSCESYT
jgi:choline-sulfatase